MNKTSYFTFLVKFYGSNKCVVEQKVVAIDEFEAKTYVVNVFGVDPNDIISTEVIFPDAN